MSNHNHQLAHPFTRLLAIVIDLLILSLLYSPLFLLMPFSPDTHLPVNLYETIVVVLFPFLFFVPLAIRIYIMVKRGQDFGKFFLNLQVINEKTNAKIGFFRYFFLRGIIGRTCVFGLIPIFGVAWNAIYVPIDTLLMFRKSRKTMHDSIAGSLVINLPKDKQRKGIFDFSKLN